MKPSVNSRHVPEETNKESAVANGFLLFFTILIVFVIPIFPKEYLNLSFTLAITAIFFFATLTFKKDKKSLLMVSVFLTMAIWASFFSKDESIKFAFRVLNFLFFIFLVINLIKNVSSTATVTLKVLVDSITGYLLLGFAFSLIVAIVSVKVPGAYNVHFFINNNEGLEPIQDNIYYTFMTFTTTGYGDIAPTHSISKSLSVLISVTGQLYVAIIIAMLIGKYASIRESKN